ncbi:MAG TPA: CHAD domain-containing protein, partial [Flavisolibacter sp.]|nr:CHAD domain-containing protein [Flavisolibacter sp.]
MKDCEKKYEQLKQQFHCLFQAFDAEANHRFRVAFKKFRACIRLYNALQPKKQLMVPKGLKQFYDAVGEIRCLQLQQETVRNLCQTLPCRFPDQYHSFLQASEASARQRARAIAKNLSLKKMQNEMHRVRRQKDSPEGVGNFVALKKHAMLKILRAIYRSDEELHQLRKTLKDILYVWSTVAPTLKEMFPKGFLTKENCIYLTEKLGAYQDLCVTLEFFEQIDMAAIHSAGERSVLQ